MKLFIVLTISAIAFGAANITGDSDACKACVESYSSLKTCGTYTSKERFTTTHCCSLTDTSSNCKYCLTNGKKPSSLEPYSGCKSGPSCGTSSKVTLDTKGKSKTFTGTSVDKFDVCIYQIDVDKNKKSMKYDFKVTNKTYMTNFNAEVWLYYRLSSSSGEWEKLYTLSSTKYEALGLKAPKSTSTKYY